MHGLSWPCPLDVAGERRGTVQVDAVAPGIPPMLLPTLFDRFARGSTSTGLGLELYLTRGIAEAHGSTLTVDSTVGTRTTFRLSVPLSAMQR